jgi:hypothetical protein
MIKSERRAVDSRKWNDMGGETPLEKMLNSYLTSHFITHKDVPIDECLSEARKIIAIMKAYGEGGDSSAAWDELGRDEFK